MKPFITNSVFLKYDVIQQNNNSCSSVALAQIIFIEMEKQNLNSFFPSILFMYYNARMNKNMDEGVYIPILFEKTMEFGIVPDTMWKYYTESPLEKPPQSCYDFGEKFPITIHSTKYEKNESMEDFITTELLNDKIILCDITLKGTNMDHTILILGVDDENYICLNSQKQDNRLESIPKSILKPQLDEKDIYAISCSFSNQCFPEMIVPDTEFELYENTEETFYQHDTLIHYDNIILGGNLSSYYLCQQLHEKEPNQSILILDNNNKNEMINFQNSPLYSNTFNSLTKNNNIELHNVQNPLSISNDEMMNYFLEPLSLDLTTPNLYYQIIYCNKIETIQNEPFLEIFKNDSIFTTYKIQIEQDFPGLDLTLPYYVILKILLFYYSTDILNYIKEPSFEWISPFVKNIEFGTFLENEAPKYASLPVDGKLLSETQCSIMMKNKIQYSDSLLLTFGQFYNTMNNDTNFVYIPNVSFIPFQKMFFYIRGDTIKTNPFFGKGFEYPNLVQFMIFESQVQILLKEKPEYIKNNIYYPITMWAFVKELFDNNETLEIMISDVSYFYLSNESNETDNNIIVQMLNTNESVHQLNTNVLGNPFIMENQCNIVNLGVKDL